MILILLMLFQVTFCSENNKYIDYQAIKYIETNPDSYLIFIFPRIVNKNEIIEDFLSKSGTIMHKKFATLEKRGPINLLGELYKNNGWQFNMNILNKRIKNTLPQNPTTILVYLFKCESMKKVREIKTDIRKVFGAMEVIHTTDNHEEALRLSKYLFLENGIHFLNNRYTKRSTDFNSFNKLLNKFRLNSKFTECLLTGDSILAAYGLKDCKNIEYLTINDNIDFQFYKKYICNLFEDPTEFFYYENVKFLSISNLKDFMINRNNSADIKNLKLIKSL